MNDKWISAMDSRPRPHDNIQNQLTMTNARSHGVFDAYFGRSPNPNPRWHEIALAAYTRCYRVTCKK